MTDKLIKVAVVGDKEEAKSFQVTRQYTPEDSDSDQDGSHDHVRSKVYQVVHVYTCTCTYMYMYIHVYVHTCICTHALLKIMSSNWPFSKHFGSLTGQIV